MQCLLVTTMHFLMFIILSLSCSCSRLTEWYFVCFWIKMFSFIRKNYCNIFPWRMFILVSHNCFTLSCFYTWDWILCYRKVFNSLSMVKNLSLLEYYRYMLYVCMSCYYRYMCLYAWVVPLQLTLHTIAENKLNKAL